MSDTIDWRGSVGKEWADKVDGLDLLLGPTGDAGIEALGDLSGKCVLDVGCGAGTTSRALAARGAIVTGADISSDLLDVARERGHANYIMADASADPLGGPHDAVYSRCGAMFFDDPVAAWSHIRSEVSKNADLSIVCWCAAKENGWASIPMHAARDILELHNVKQAPVGTPGPFGWADPAYFAPVLEQAGWRDLSWEAVERPAMFTTGDNPDPVERAVEFTLRVGILARHLKGKSPELRAKVANSLRGVFHKYVEDDAVYVPTKAWVITGKG
ncbi:class I SAM-dependent methyltransferase [Amylibacter sp. SFDW26]|uniref:class I SAM-dependent methyltransferase n=1 Tax=Amylibacter sp. SFDW26 TaxID=2652722 RepID=UPI001261572C|nr:class I SAM-dependent methyltransferase [Amylibacter sp. SFDW26]KAB7615535.1 class I SAM-dependent methyltransferase [Amylibacter sp. SFDW26]